MLTLTQFGSDLKTQAVPNRPIIKEPPSDRSTYRFIQIRGGSFRSKFKESPPAQLNVINNVNYNFRKPSAVSEDEQMSAQFKVMLLGDSGVGKTCLLIRFKDKAFMSGSYIATIGIDYRNKVLVVDGAKVKLQIWDTAGQERFRSVTHAYYRDAHALFLLYDVTNRKSFDNTRAWLAEINEYAHRDVIIMLLGNKCDSEDRIVDREDGERLAREYKVNFMETSAKTGLNVELAFIEVARALRDKRTTVSASYGVQEYVEPSQWSQNVCSACGTS
ncbi:ras-related protein Rab-37-like isoform X2 [Daphnia pulicaria]|uniref:ras-related protein Rab-37-like isoform X2 n=1 Tax=Daphnia pulicaria TaxID=35523 RepID=UPI001EECBAFC|nr:ras-related protein Rab-37-like isoform X2 [Daphnia pulicaria]